VVEGIESLQAELERSGFGQTHIVLERQIELVDSRPIEKTALGVS
jgi:hypothetical protein